MYPRFFTSFIFLIQSRLHYVLHRLVREAERNSTKKSIELRDEIFSLGGMQALLALFRPQEGPLNYK